MAAMPKTVEVDRLCHLGPEDSGLRQLEAFTAAQYARRYGAHLAEFYPHQLALYDGTALRACVGFRPAAEGRLFLEQYLDEPIEAVLGARFGRLRGREGIVEVGGLAAARPGAGRRLILLAADWLHGAGFRLAAFTATRCLANSFRRLRLKPLELAIADPGRLEAHRSDWGRYYAHDPRVFAGPIVAAARARRPRRPVDGAAPC